MQVNKWPVLKGRWALTLGLAALMIYTVLLPVQPFFLPITSGIVLFWLVYVLSFQKQRLTLLLKNPLALLWVVYYLWVVFGLFYSHNSAQGAKVILLKITLLLWPIGVATWPKLIEKYRPVVLQVFSWVVVCSALYLSTVGLWRWAQSGLSAGHIHSFTTDVYTWIPNHYIALYASFAIIYFLGDNLSSKKILSLNTAAVAILLLFLGLVGVRIQFLALPLAFLVYLIFYSSSRKTGFKHIALGLWVVVASLAVMMAVPSSRKRALETIDEVQSARGIENKKQTNHRVYLWSYGKQVIEENLWLGTGTGAANDALHEKLKTCDARFWDGERTYTLSEKKYNFHNSFLQHWATHGLPGFLILMAIFVLPFYFFRENIDALGAAFLTLCFISFLTESMLERQAGVLFFGYMYSVFFIGRSNMAVK